VCRTHCVPCGFLEHRAARAETPAPAMRFAPRTSARPARAATRVASRCCAMRLLERERVRGCGEQLLQESRSDLLQSLLDDGLRSL
jgi:hypothetical protein